MIVGRIEKDAGERERDEDRPEPVDDERGRGAVLGQDVLIDERCRERDDPHGDQEQKVQVEEAPVDARAVLEKGVVIHPDDADREEAHEVRRVGRPEAQERGGQIGRVSGHAELQDEQRRRDREDAVAEGLEPARAHRPSLNEPPEGLPRPAVCTVLSS